MTRTALIHLLLTTGEPGDEVIVSVRRPESTPLMGPVDDVACDEGYIALSVMEAS
jgi:hypothetical protein